MDPDDRLDLIKDEYVMLQGFYQDIDERCLTIKGWSITVGLAALGGGFVYSEVLFWGAALSGLLFWYLEGHWRGLTFFFTRRILEIEAAVQDGREEELTPLQVYHSWERTYAAHGGQTLRYMRKDATWLPHVFISLVGAALYFLKTSGVF